jgi:four helix bundle protein
MDAANSIRFNIAEGCGTNTDGHLSLHLGHSLRSANEAEDELQHIADIDLLSSHDHELLEEIGQLRAMIAAFKQKVDQNRRTK